MSQYPSTDGRDHVRIATEASSSDGSRGDRWDISEAAGRPRLRVRTVERTAVVRFEDAEILFAEGAVARGGPGTPPPDRGRGAHAAGGEFRRGADTLSSDVLGVLAGLQREVGPVRGSIVLCGLDPLLRDMVRITHLDRVFDICGDEAEALGRMLRA